MEVRDATVEDLDKLVEFNAGLALETEGKTLEVETLRQGVAALLADPVRGRYLVADESGDALGALAITLEWSDWRNAWYWWIQSVYVSPHARRRGVYRALYQAVLSRAQRDESVCGIRLYVDNQNTPAQAVYEALGMSVSNYRMFEVDCPSPGCS